MFYKPGFRLQMNGLMFPVVKIKPYRIVMVDGDMVVRSYYRRALELIPQ